MVVPTLHGEKWWGKKKEAFQSHLNILVKTSRSSYTPFGLSFLYYLLSLEHNITTTQRR